MENKQDGVEIIDFCGEEFNKRSLPCSVGLLIMLLIAIINMIIMVIYPGTYTSLYISLAIIAGFVLYYSYIIAQNPGKIRKFTICTEDIELVLPNISCFKIKWTEFKKLEIRMRKFNYKPYCIYELHFINLDTDKVVKLSLSDFHKVKIEEIMVLLKNFSKIMKKEFLAVRETNISGIIQVEQLKI